MGRTVITGVRWAESSRRKEKRAMLELNAYSKSHIMLNNDNDAARRMLESCQMKGKHILNPIIDWTEAEVWEFLSSNHIKHCCLYDENFRRIGCIGCPMSGKAGMLREFERYPKYRAAYVRAFDRMMAARTAAGLTSELWTDGESVMDWWIFGKEKIFADNDQINFNDADFGGDISVYI